VSHSRRASSPGFTQRLMHPARANSHQRPLLGRGVPAATAHPANAPLSNEFLMSLTSTWEPGTLKMPCCCRPGKEQRFGKDSCNRYTVLSGKAQQKRGVSAPRKPQSRQGTACYNSLLLMFSDQGPPDQSKERAPAGLGPERTI